MARQERAERTRKLLIRAAAASFDQVGFATTGLNDVTRPTGISKGALYFHFGSKELLAEAVIAESRRGLREVVRRARHSAGCPLQYLIDLSHGLAHLLATDIVFRAGLRLTDDNGLPEDQRPNPHPAWVRLVNRELTRCSTAGRLHSGAGVEEAAGLLAAATAGVEIIARRDRNWLDPKVITRLWEAVLPLLVPADQLAGLRVTPRSPVDGPAPCSPVDGPASFSPVE
ncbi:ScbR family autoregulator-binding transcription factor [Kitasatospora sp. NPDC096147]|uniref:ScbR family autoregulator-binding transcription factor n=1 Tax=Kitasatospora sp. NPDC096147 TaxID=3364093 RepID=UPI0038257480